MLIGKGRDLGNGYPPKSLFIRSGCLSKIPQAGLFKQNNFVTALEAGSPRSEFFLRALLLRLAGAAPSHHAHMHLCAQAEKERAQALWFSSYKDANFVELRPHPYDLI